MKHAARFGEFNGSVHVARAPIRSLITFGSEESMHPASPWSLFKITEAVVEMVEA